MEAPRADLLAELVAPRLGGAASGFFQRALSGCAAEPTSIAFGQWLSGASRVVNPRTPLLPTDAERARVRAEGDGAECERWGLLETFRMALAAKVSAFPGGDRIMEDAFVYADEGELAALLRSAAWVQRPAALLWRVGEGCRSNLRTVFEAAACDTPYPARHFDGPAFRQVLLKSLFVGAPLWRIQGLDRRLDAELARMALDYADERRSAGRHVPAELWLCLGAYGGERGRVSLEQELVASSEPPLEGASAGHGQRSRAAVGLALLRAGERERLEALATAEANDAIARLWRTALSNGAAQSMGRDLESMGLETH